MIEKLHQNAAPRLTDARPKSANSGNASVHNLFRDVLRGHSFIDKMKQNEAQMAGSGKASITSSNAIDLARLDTKAPSATAFAPAAVNSPQPTDTGIPSTAGIDLKVTFGGTVTPASAAPAGPPPAPTPQSVFGPNVWIDNPSGTAPNGVQYSYNPIYFATRETANKIAAMVGGTVFATNALAPNGGFQQSSPNWMVRLPGGQVVNPGLIADFYNHGYPQHYVDYLVEREIQGAQA